MSKLSLLLALLAALAASGAGAAQPRPQQETATLLVSQTAFATPSTASTSRGIVPKLRPITEDRTVLPVVAHRQGSDGERWLHVRLPGRPNGHTGWIRERGTSLDTTPWRLRIERAKRRVLVLRDGIVVRTLSAVVGAPSTPTPRGEFFVEEAVTLGPGEVGAPFALALSARSTVFQEFAGGPGQIALHGLANVGGTLGTAASHGCVRLDDAAMRWLVHRIGPGVPVTITD